jgi:hypothetical protein
MPKPSKTRPKQKAKSRKAEPETPSFTAKKSYWVTLLAVFTVVSAVFGMALGLGLLQTTFLALMVATLIGFVGYVRVSPSTLGFSKRATFIFVGASVIGFGTWAAAALAFMPQIVALNNDFFTISSLVICLTVGGFIGELLGRNRKVQERLFGGAISL